MDQIDRRILRLLQRDASLPIGRIAEEVGISTTPCWRRIQNLERDGTIKARVAVLNRERLNVPVTVFVSFKTGDHSADWLERFARHISDIEEVTDFYRMSGSVDYLAKIVVPDIAAYDAVYKRLISIGGLADVSSSFAMEEIKFTGALPLKYLP